MLSWNRGIDEAERVRRADRYYRPYHDAIDALLARRLGAGQPTRLCSVHSFTPSYLGRTRPMEVGVLFDVHHDLAWHLEGALSEEGFDSVLNAPYSALDGLIYSAQRHGRNHDVPYLELEVRQDLIDTPEKARDVAERLARALREYAPPQVEC